MLPRKEHCAVCRVNRDAKEKEGFTIHACETQMFQKNPEVKEGLSFAKS